MRLKKNEVDFNPKLSVKFTSPPVAQCPEKNFMRGKKETEWWKLVEVYDSEETIFGMEEALKI
jgi:hypothetical protein